MNSGCAQETQQASFSTCHPYSPQPLQRRTSRAAVTTMTVANATALTRMEAIAMTDLPRDEGRTRVNGSGCKDKLSRAGLCRSFSYGRGLSPRSEGEATSSDCLEEPKATAVPWAYPLASRQRLERRRSQHPLPYRWRGPELVPARCSNWWPSLHPVHCQPRQQTDLSMVNPIISTGFQRSSVQLPLFS